MGALQRVCLVALSALVFVSAQAAPCDGWPAWQDFRRHFVSDGGRVLDRGADGQPTTSEGQSYALFFALAANDRPAFDKLLQWTRDNLAGGDFSARLPAWQWGKRPDGQWGVMDDNSASDSDLWIAYDLLEAGRLWREPRYTALGKLLALRIAREETTDLPGLGPTLLPGRYGFSKPGLTRLNPSYLPPQLMARMAHALPGSNWAALRGTSQRVLLESAPAGFAPDWIGYRNGFVADDASKASGSYNAIRVYLWAGMLAPDAPERAALLARLKPMARQVAKTGLPPETVDTRDGKVQGSGPIGFSMALLPFLQAQGDQAALQTQLLRVEAMPLSERPDAYYDHVLTLFGQGWQQARYRFKANGELVPAWEGACAPS
ncbi:endo-1,4-D-glucanase [Chromobacterium vaccinii]|uniref:cellulose synthase complex periplasmic endoglucanase BcsZ n=1 Tax=Chromobacterium vaccinii TaxID=1108595 RepID=UPI000CE9834D|nr:cellulose synthase complex periplasmic endoglucanase BcsZ [Chromobacterium vaccinii]AVG17562.1 endo-1,4-D-glucanase [Chromobacterium vaccinii]